MRRNGMRGCQPRAFRRTTIPDSSVDTRRDLVRGIWDRGEPDRVWVSDVTLWAAQVPGMAAKAVELSMKGTSTQ